MPISGKRQAGRGARLRWQFGRAAAALALAFLATSAIAPGVETIFAQSTPLRLAQADTLPNSAGSPVVTERAVSDAATAVADAAAPGSAQPADVPTSAATQSERVAAREGGGGETIALATSANHDDPNDAPVPAQLAAATPSREDALAFLAQLDAESLQPRSRGTSQAVDAEPAWQDQYLFADDELPPLDQAAMLGAQPFGQETLAVDLTSFTSDDAVFGEDTERGARIYWSRETENWGTFDLDLQVADMRSSFVGRQVDDTEAVITLRQSLIPVSATSVLSTTAGHQRSSLSSLLHGGYRYRMPSSIFLGFNGELAGIDSRSRVSLGNVGAYRGLRMPRFDDTGGRLASFAYERTVNDLLELGAEITSVNNDDDIRDHTSALVGGRYRRPDDSQEHAFRLLADDDSRFGLWTDSRVSFANLSTLRFGLSYLEPEVVWADLPIPDDQLGVYVRADRGTSAFDFAAGYDFIETGIDSAAPASTTTHSAYLTAQMRIRRAFTLGATTSLAVREIDASVSDDQDIARMNIYASLRNPLGTARIEAFTHTIDTRLDSNRREREGLALSMSWRMPQRVRLTTELRSEQENGQYGKIERNELSALFRYDLFDNLTMGLTSSVYATRGDEYSADDGLSLSADAQWTINRNWRATFSLNRNLADYRVSNINALADSPNTGTTSAWLTVSYQRSRGQPYPTFGRTQDGMSGSGAISGEIYFDENRDSVRQPSERVAAGVVVVLDGRYETRTDLQGRYSFSPVPTGAHELVVVTDDLPLPWGLENEAPRAVVVRFRQDTPVDFPLTIMN